MAQIQKKFLANASVDGTKIQLLNAQSFVALNSSASPVNLFNFDSSNNIQLTQQVDANSNAIINLPTPVNPGDAVNKSYADSLVSNLSWKDVVESATTTALPAYGYVSGVITETAPGALPAQDGVTLTVGQRLLVKDETGGNQPYNGIYTVTVVGDVSTQFVLTRATDANTAAELQFAATYVGGDAATQAGFVFFESADITTLGTDNVTFVQINAGMSYIFSNGLHLSGSTVTVEAFDTSINVASGGISVNLATNSGLEVSSGLLIELADTSLVLGAGGIKANLNSSGALATSSGLEVKVDTSTVQINGSNQLHSVTQQVDNLTLSSGDITNQYKDLTYAITGTGSVWLSVIGGPIQTNGTDYTVSATGGSGGVGRITFAGALATAGASALVSGDILVVGYEHF